MTLTYQHIEAAADRLNGQIERTPQRRSRTLSEITGAEVWVKFENLQFTASFKERGALNKLLTLTEDERRRGVIAASAGNHAQALAYHAARLGVPVTIVMPKATPTVKVEHTRRFGAEVVIEGDSYDEAGEHAAAISDPGPLSGAPWQTVAAVASTASAKAPTGKTLDIRLDRQTARGG